MSLLSRAVVPGAALATSLLAACPAALTPKSEPSADVTLVVTASATTSATDASPLRPAPGPVTELVPPAAVACHLDATAHFKRRAAATFAVPPYELRFAPGRPAFATIIAAPKGEIDIAIGETAKTGAFMRVDYEELRVWGVIEPSDLRLHARKPFALRGIFVPDDEAILRPSAGESGKVTVRYEDLESAHLAMTSGALEDARPCGDLDLESNPFEADPVVPKQTLKTMYLIARAKIAATANDPPIAELSPTEGDDAVRVVARSGKLARIVAERRHGSVVGWVAETALSSKAPGNGYGNNGPVPGPRSAYGRVRLGEQRSCDHDVDLIARQGSDARIVGKLRAKHPISTGVGSVVGEQAVQLGGLFGPGEGVSFSVRASDLADCGSNQAKTSR